MGRGWEERGEKNAPYAIDTERNTARERPSNPENGNPVALLSIKGMTNTYREEWGICSSAAPLDHGLLCDVIWRPRLPYPANSTPSDWSVPSRQIHVSALIGQLRLIVELGNFPFRFN